MSRPARPISKAYDGRADAEHAIEVAAASRYMSVPALSLGNHQNGDCFLTENRARKACHTPPAATDLRSRMSKVQCRARQVDMASPCCGVDDVAAIPVDVGDQAQDVCPPLPA